MALSETIQSILDAATKDQAVGIPGFVFAAVDKSGKVLTANASGKRGLRNEEPMTVNSCFWIASATKLFTATAVMQLVEQGKLHLDDAEELKRLIPFMGTVKQRGEDGELIERSRDITLRMLLTHTAGFTFPMSDARQDKWKEYDNQTLFFEPGKTWCYSPGIYYSGTLIEIVTGKTMQEVFEENIFKPLEIRDLGYWITSTMKANFTDIHLRLPDGSIIAIDNPAVISDALDVPGTKVKCDGDSGCFGSVLEYTKLIATLLNDGTSPTTGAQILKPETVQTMLHNQLPHLPNLGRQGFPGAPNIANPTNDLYPQAGNPPQGWSFAGMLNLQPDSSTGRHANSVWWSGLGNLYWWMDREAGVGGILASQILPWLDENVLSTWKKTEKAVYDSF